MADPVMQRIARLPIACETRRSYASKIRGAMRACGADTFASMVAAPAASFRKLERRYPADSTRRQVVTSVLSGLAASETWCRQNPDCHARWRAYHAEMARATARRGPTFVDDATLDRTYVCWSEIVRAHERCRRDKDAHATLDSSMAALLLAVVTQMPPKRSDFGATKVTSTAADAGAGNRVVLGTTHAVDFVIDDHKTAKTHGALVERANRRLANVVRASLARFPRAYLFVTATGRPMSPAAYGAFVKRVMLKHVGKPVGTTALRHIFISDVVSRLESREARAAIAARMLHSVKEQARYVVKRRDGGDVCAA